MAEQRATFASAAREAGGVPSFVDESFERFLRCGVLAHGFARFGCASCGHDHLVPLSCKTRGLCPSCGGRRMAALTRHIMDYELPLLTLKTRWRDGTTHLRLDPIELMERLAAQIPKPRINLVLYAGVLAPNAKLRAEVVRHARPAALPDAPATETQTRAERETWSELMRVTFQLDVLACPRCGGRLRHIATILDARVRTCAAQSRTSPKMPYDAGGGRGAVCPAYPHAGRGSP